MSSAAQLQRSAGNQAVGDSLRNGYDIKITHEIQLGKVEGFGELSGKFAIEIDLLQPFFTGRPKEQSDKVKTAIALKFKQRKGDLGKAAAELSLTAAEYEAGNVDLGGGISLSVKFSGGEVDIGETVGTALGSVTVKAQGVIKTGAVYAPIASLFLDDDAIAAMVNEGLQIKFALSAKYKVRTEDLENLKRQRQLKNKLLETERKAKPLAEEGTSLAREIDEAQKKSESLERERRKKQKLIERKQERLEKLARKHKKNPPLKPDRRLERLQEAIGENRQRQNAIQKELDELEDLIGKKKKRIGDIVDEVHDIAVDTQKTAREIERLGGAMKSPMGKLLGKRLLKTALRTILRFAGPIFLLLDAIELIKIALYFDRLTFFSDDGVPLDELPFIPPPRGEGPPTSDAVTDGPEGQTQPGAEPGKQSVGDEKPEELAQQPEGDAPAKADQTLDKPGEALEGAPSTKETRETAVKDSSDSKPAQPAGVQKTSNVHALTVLTRTANLENAQEITVTIWVYLPGAPVKPPLNVPLAVTLTGRKKAGGQAFSATSVTIVVIDYDHESKHLSFQIPNGADLKDELTKQVLIFEAAKSYGATYKRQR